MPSLQAASSRHPPAGSAGGWETGRAGKPRSPGDDGGIARRLDELIERLDRVGLKGAPAKDDEVGAVAAAIGKLAERMQATENNARLAVARLAERIDSFESRLAPATPGNGGRGLEALSATVEELAGELESAERTTRSMVAALRDRTSGIERRRPARDPRLEVVADVIRQLEERLAMSERTPAPPLRPSASPVDSRLRDVRARLDGLMARHQLNAQAPAPPPPAPPADTAALERLGRIDRRLAEISARLGDAPPAAEAAEPAARLDQRAAELRAAIDEIAARQKTIDRPAVAAPLPAAPAPSQSPSANAFAEIESLLTPLRRDISRLAAGLDKAGAPPPAASTEAALADIAARLERLDRSAGRRDERVDLLSAHFDALRDLIGSAPPADRYQAEELGERLDRLAAALASGETLRGRGLDGIARQVESLQGGLEGLARETSLQSLEAGYGHIVERLDTLARTTPDRRRIDDLAAAVASLGESVGRSVRGADAGALERRLAELATAVERSDKAADIARLERQLADLSRGIQASGGRTEPALREFGQQLAEIQHALAAAEQNPRSADGLARLELRVADLADRLDVAMARGPRPESFTALLGHLGTIAERLDRHNAVAEEPPAAVESLRDDIADLKALLLTQGRPEIAALEQQVRNLAARLESAPPEGDTAALGQLEAQVAELATRLDADRGQPAAFVQVEESLGRLESLLAGRTAESIEAARDAARAAVAELTGSAAESPVVRALKEDLVRLQAAAQNADSRTQVTLGSVHETLERVVERIASLESETRQQNAAEAQRQQVSPSGGWRRRESDRLLEPGSGKPAAAPQPMAASMPSEAVAPAEPAAPPATADRRADFIAAARRAAQAAAAEAAGLPAATAADTGPEAESSHRPGPLARLGQAFRGRRRPLVLAAAAVVLTLAAVKLFGVPGLGGHAAPDAVAFNAAAPPAETRSAPASPQRVAGADVPPAAAAPAPRPVAAAFASPPAAQPAAIASRAAADSGQQAIRMAVAASPAQSATPGGADPALLAFAPPDGLGSRFGAAPAAPPADAFGPAAGQPDPTQDAATPDRPEAAIGPARLIDAAMAGEAPAAFEVAMRYAEGRGVRQDAARAAAWYEQAADAGLALAQYRVGSLYERGAGVARDVATAEKWYGRAAAQGNVGAMHNLAVLLSEGANGPADLAEATEWFGRAAEHGVRDSQYNLGVIYARGVGVPQDLVQSYKWFAVAAAAGDTDAAARRDEVEKALSPDQIAQARVLAKGWRAATPIAAANSVEMPTDGWGDPGPVADASTSSDLVKRVQQLLASRGYDPGPADGKVGAKTRDAVMAFQRSRGGEPTGSIGPDLLAQLDGAAT